MRLWLVTHCSILWATAAGVVKVVSGGKVPEAAGAANSVEADGGVKRFDNLVHDNVGGSKGVLEAERCERRHSRNGDVDLSVGECPRSQVYAARLECESLGLVNRDRPCEGHRELNVLANDLVLYPLELMVPDEANLLPDCALHHDDGARVQPDDDRLTLEFDDCAERSVRIAWPVPKEHDARLRLEKQVVWGREIGLVWFVAVILLVKDPNLRSEHVGLPWEFREATLVQIGGSGFARGQYRGARTGKRCSDAFVEGLNTGLVAVSQKPQDIQEARVVRVTVGSSEHPYSPSDFLHHSGGEKVGTAAIAVMDELHLRIPLDHWRKLRKVADQENMLAAEWFVAVEIFPQRPIHDVEEICANHGDFVNDHPLTSFDRFKARVSLWEPLGFESRVVQHSGGDSEKGVNRLSSDVLRGESRRREDDAPSADMLCETLDGEGFPSAGLSCEELDLETRGGT